MPLEFNFCILRCFINWNSKIQSKQFIRELNLSLQSRNTQVANEILSGIGILSLMICSMICRRFSRRLKFCRKNHIESEAIFFFSSLKYKEMRIFKYSNHFWYWRVIPKTQNAARAGSSPCQGQIFIFKYRTNLSGKVAAAEVGIY